MMRPIYHYLGHEMTAAAPAVSLWRDDQQSFLAALDRSGRLTAPYRHWLMTDILPAAQAEELHALPVDPPSGLTFSGRRETNNNTRYYFNAESQARFPAARALADAFQAPETVAAIEKECGVNLAGTNLRLEYCLDTDGFWLEPHTDIGVKQFTMLIYLSRGEGSEDWGTDVYDGDFNLVRTAPCLFNSGLIFIPGTDTWHGFKPRHIGGVRKSIIINYVGPEWRARHELAFPETPVK
jgi:hypothetical protein